MKKKSKLFLVAILMTTYTAINAQDSSRIFFTTGAGLVKSPGSLNHVLHPSIAFNSGIEVSIKKNWFVQGTLDFNTLKYDQRIKEDGSPYLFQNTSSSLFMAAVNGGKNFHFGHNKWFASLYTGGGYLTIGEPRLVDDTENRIKQEVSRKASVFGKAGTRVGYRTKIKFLQTVYLDGSYWISPLKVQGSGLSGVSLFVGARMSVN